MRVLRLRTFLSFILVVACCFLYSCSARAPRPLAPESDVSHALADSMLQSVLAANEGLYAVKGVGRVKLQLDGQPETFRALWIGRQPDQFLLKVLAITGQPILSFACDGNRIYFLSHSDNKLHRGRATENSLKRIVGIDITLEDFLDLISGQLPVHRGGSVRLEEPDDSGPLLILDGKGLKYIDTISLDIDRITVRGFERRERGGKLLFRVLIEKWRETDGFRLPETITIEDENGGMIHIAVQRVWVNPELSDDQFVLKAS